MQILTDRDLFSVEAGYLTARRCWAGCARQFPLFFYLCNDKNRENE
jgi:hypothetical protein